MDELKMTDCDFEKGVPAMLILDLADVKYKQDQSIYSSSIRVNTAYYQRFKIFKDKGTGRVQKRIPVTVSNNEEIKNIYAISYNLVNGEIRQTVLAPDDIHRTKLNDRQEIVTFAAPGVQPGSVVEMAYELEENVNNMLPRWYFTSDIPNAYSSISVGFLDALVYYVQKHNVVGDTIFERREDFSSEVKYKSGYSAGYALPGTRRTYTMSHVRSYEAEPYTNASRNYTSWINFQFSYARSPFGESDSWVSSFDKFADKLYSNDDFLGNLALNPVPRKQWKALISDTMNSEEKARALFEFVRANLSDNGKGGTTTRNTNSMTWKNKTGSQTEINLLLISVLRAAGLPAYPMLVGDRRLGKVNQNYPIFADYTGIDALVEISGDKKIVLDASEKFLPFGEPPLDQINTMGWEVKGLHNHDWYSIGETSPSRTNVMITADMDDEGQLHGVIDIIYTNHEAEKMMALRNAGKQSATANYLKVILPNVNIEAISDSVLNDAHCFRQQVKFTMQVNRDNDDDIFISPGNIYGSNVNPFVNITRRADVDFGNTGTTVVSMRLTLPTSYRTDSLMPSYILRTSDSSASYSFRSEVEDGVLATVSRLDFHRAFYPVEEYPMLFEFEKKYIDTRQRPVILHRNKL
ncbi:MAG: hypothetical protein JST76_04630 [Bacteroidetes bacterium]|nr:hypothetical protein [Bacteroidota bacterium]